MQSLQKDLIKSSLKGLLVFDAVASPAHWYYDRHALKDTYVVSLSLYVSVFLCFCRSCSSVMTAKVVVGW